MLKTRSLPGFLHTLELVCNMEYPYTVLLLYDVQYNYFYIPTYCLHAISGDVTIRNITHLVSLVHSKKLLQYFDAGNETATFI